MLTGMGETRRMATAADLLVLERHEVVDGELVEKAAPSFEHGGAQIVIGGLLLGYSGRGGGRGPGGWWLGTEVEIELEPHQVYLPDVTGWRIERVPERPHGRPIRIAPDWVCEILSPSTASRDLGRKQRGYHRAHVGHFWIIDPQNLSLTVLRWSETGYPIVLSAGPGEVVRAEPFDAAELSVAEIFGVEG
jgi:Uma2 family endonuclease